ncbi:MAG TPA: DUF5060 domain-containing protein [Planctomycetota bacterium]|nr:DUF5060 domain-containing protein [Planctomycetota bacterium]
MSRRLLIGVLLGLTLCVSAASAADVPRYELFEVTFTSDETFANPFWEAAVWAVFTSPDGREVRVDGYHHGGKEWKVRFVPGVPGKWTWSATMAGKGTSLRQTGEFTCVKSSRHGFLRVSKANPFRFEYDDGTPAYLIGYQHGGLLRVGHDGPGPDGKWRSVALEDYLKDFDGAANLNRTNLSCGDRRGMSHAVLKGDKGLDYYDVETAATLDETYRLYHKYNVSQILIFYQDMSLWGSAGQSCFGHIHDVVNYKNVNAANLPMQEKYLKYIVARYGAFVDIWELFNEDTYAPNDYLAHLAKVIRDADPYDHPVTTNYERPDQAWCEVVCPHEYVSISAEQVDGHLVNEFGRLKAWGKPVQYTEFGNKRNFSNVDPIKWRIVVWTCWANEVGMLFWSMSGTKTVPADRNKPGNANTYLGPETRKSFRILMDFVRELPVDMRPVTIINPNHNRDVRVGGLSNGDLFCLYVHHWTSHETTVNPEPFLLWTGPGRFHVTWIDPATGQVVRDYEAGTGQNVLPLSVPPVKIDVACRMRRMKPGEVLLPRPGETESRVLFSFEDGVNPFSAEEDVKDAVEMSVVAEAGKATTGARSLRVVLKPHDWPGINTTRIPADWTQYEALRFDVTADQDMTLAVRIDDVDTKDYSTRYNSRGSFVTKGRNTVTVWLSDVATGVDPKKIKAVYLFSMGVGRPMTFTLDNVRLERRREPGPLR